MRRERAAALVVPIVAELLVALAVLYVAASVIHTTRDLAMAFL